MAAPMLKEPHPSSQVPHVFARHETEFVSKKLREIAAARETHPHRE
jgi:hypothetical protein